LVWFDGDEAAAAMDQGGLLAHDVVPRVPWTALGRALIPADGAYAPTGVTLAGVFIRRTGSPGPAPARWSDLVSPALAGKVGMNNPTISGPTYPLIAGLLAQNGGWPGGEAFLVALKRNGLRVYPKNSNTLAALRAQEIDLAMTQSSAAWNAAGQAPGLEVTTPVAGLVLPSVIAVAAHQDAKAQAAARRFIAFAMSPAVQQLRLTKGGADSFYWPITTDAPPPRAPLPPLAVLNLVRLDPNVWGRREAAVNTWFERTVLEP
jgi:iron(III) transport system substrate-binding protein